MLILGDLVITTDEGPIELGTTRERAVIEALALAVGDSVSVSTLVDALWGDDPPRSASRTLQSHVSRARRHLPVGAIETTANGYRLGVDAETVDAERLSVMLADADRAAVSGNVRVAADLLDRAVALWRGSPVPDLADGPYRAGQIARLEALHNRATAARVDAHLALGDHDRLLPDLQQLVEARPYDERLRCQLMLALHRAGRRIDALESYVELRDVLRDDLGIGPSAATRELEYRIRRDDVELEFRPPPPMSTLPAPVSTFVGRRRLLDEISTDLQQHRLVTLVGPGGVGKTRVAIEAARLDRDRWPGGTFFVDLSGLDDVDEAVADLWRQLSPAGRSGPGPRAASAAAPPMTIANRTTLVVFDGAETMAGPLGSTIAALLEGRPDATVLATSRVPLSIPGEHLVDVPAMELPADTADATPHAEAIRLFLDRCTHPERLAGQSSLSAVAELCRFVDGLPLGIELLALRVGTIPVAALVEQIRRDQDAVLTVHRPGATGPHSSLEAVLDNTVQLLTVSERRLLGRLSVFRGTFDIAGVRAVGGDPALADLTRLTEFGLVMPANHATLGDRFRLLDTTRMFAGRLLDDDEIAAAERAHAIHYEQLARRIGDRLDGPDEAFWGRRRDHEAPNLRTALVWFLVHQPRGALGFAHTLAREADHWGDMAVACDVFQQLLDAAEHDPTAPTDDVAWVLVGIGWPRFLTGDIEGAVEAAESAATAFASTGNPYGACQALADRAHMELLATADQSRAAIWYEQALAAAPRHTLQRGTVLVEYSQALVLADLHDDRVDRMLDEAETLLRDTHDHHRLAHLAMIRSIAAYAVDDLDTTERLAEEVLHESQRAGTRVFAQLGELAIGTRLLHSTDPTSASTHLRTAVRMAIDDHNVLQAAIALQTVAIEYVLSGRSDEAAVVWATALTHAPLWPMFRRRYTELLGPDAVSVLDAAFAQRRADGAVAPIARVIDAVLDLDGLPLDG